MQLFYTKDINHTQTTFTFNKEESKHIIKVLRKKNGDILYVTNGIGYLFTTKIITASDSKCMVEIVTSFFQEKQTNTLHLAVAPTKMNDRYEWFLEKATEIGVTEITPIICANSERDKINIDRFEKIIISAMKQSNQFYLPSINDAITFKKFIEKPIIGQKYIAHCEESDKKSLKNTLQANQSATILIGPEGDFSAKEIELALQTNFIAVTLGNTRLRTETAAVVACHSFQFINE